MNQTVMFKKSKEGDFIADFDPEESNHMMQSIVRSLKGQVSAKVEKEYEHDGNRLKKVKIRARDGSFQGEITHVPIDYFGERGAEVRTVLSLNPGGERRKDEIRAAISESGLQEMKA